MATTQNGPSYISAKPGITIHSRTARLKDTAANTTFATLQSRLSGQISYDGDVIARDHYAVIAKLSRNDHLRLANERRSVREAQRATEFDVAFANSVAQVLIRLANGGA